MNYVDEDFLLSSSASRRLYHEFAKDQPVLDFHNHLSPRDVFDNRRFDNLFELWLAGDHYKWRAMRANGIDEHRITGSASPWEKFLAWATTVPKTLRNPLFHWTHLELFRCFGIADFLNESNARQVWDRTRESLADSEHSAQGILRRFNVRAICTTDDPADDLHYHSELNRAATTFRMYPTFRPDRALDVHGGDRFIRWLRKLERASNTSIESLDGLLNGLSRRHAEFHQIGCRLSDHGLPACYSVPCDEAVAAQVFAKTTSGKSVTDEEASIYRSYLMLHFARLDSRAGWTKQLHLGACRNNNTRLMQSVGPDCGADSIGDWPQVESLGRYLDFLDREGSLPKMIVYNLNPSDSYSVASMLGNFQSGPTAGKLQTGSAWWFLDQIDGIREQLNTLSRVGLLSTFVGMVTDSRSFPSLARHEYFRRILCELLGREIESGELPTDFNRIGTMVAEICFGNAKRFLELEL